MTQPTDGRCPRPHPNPRLAKAVATLAAGAAVLALAGCGGPVSGSENTPAAPVSPPAPANLAYVDTKATTDAADGVKKAVETVFSYDSTQAAAVAQNEQEYLTGPARAAFDQTFAQVKTTPVQTQTKVLDSGVLDLTRTSAKVLVIAGQQSSGQNGQKNSATAMMLLTAKPVGGRWQLSQIEVSPKAAAEPASGPAGTPAATRDQVLATARKAAAILLTVDAKNADALFDSYESVAADPLLTQFRETRAHTVDSMKQSGAKASLDPQSIAAVSSLSADGTKAEVLLGGIVNSQQQGGEQQRQIPARLTMVMQGATWKVSGINTVTQGS
jgi:Mce-associated membrane protein